MSASILKEFLVKIGFKVDEAGQRKLAESMQGIGKSSISLAKNFAALGASVVGTGVAAAVGLQKIAKPLEGLYFAAQRTGASAKELKVLQGSFEQIGISAEETQGAIEQFSAARRSMPGIDQMFQIDPKSTDDAKNFLKVLEQLAASDTGGAFTHAVATQKAAMLGISEQTLTQFEKNRAAFNKTILPQREKLVGKFDVDKMAKTSHDYASGFRDAATNTELLADKIATGVMPAAEKGLEVTQRLEDVYNKIDDKTGGWLGHLTAVAGVSSSILTTYKAIAALRGIVGGAAAAEGAGAAATAAGGAAAGGTGLLASIAGVAGGLVAPVVAAVVGSHFLNKATKGTWWDTDQQAAPGQKETGLKDQIAGIKQSFSGFTKSLAEITAGFEGHAKAGYGLYKDIAGHLTAGYGHLVKPGEDFSKGLDKQGALALLTKDLQAAGESVKKLVHVTLSSNQMKALTDFVFNLGGHKLKQSTLLKELNAGHMDAAAAQFSRWNKAMEGGHLVANEGLTRRRAAEAELFNTPDSKPSVTLHQETNIHVEGGDKSTAQEVARQQGRVNGDLVRNFAGATS
jgi:lysozyme